MKCPCCNKEFSIIDYIKSLFINNKELEEEVLPNCLTDSKGKLHSWYEKKLWYIHKKCLSIRNDFGKNNTDKRRDYFHKIEELIKENTDLTASIWMCDNIWGGDIFFTTFYVWDSQESKRAIEIEVGKVMNDGKKFINISGDESIIRPNQILKIIDIVDNVDKYLMAEELCK